MPHQIRLGDIAIDRIVEQEGPFFDALSFFPTLTPALLAENRGWLEPRYLEPGTGKLVLCIQSYLVRTRRRTILIDTCVGNHKPRPARPFWNNLASDRYEKGLAGLGVGVGDVDMVMCTHLHVDHVGWNTRLDNGRWVPTFPNARYLFSERELGFWTERHSSQPETCPWIGDSVIPIVEAQKCELVTSRHEVSDEMRFIPTPGHTIDHFSVHVGRTGADAVILGDMIHSPLQARYPEIGMMSDYDSAEAGRSRRALFGRFCDTATLMCAAHFAAPSTGRIMRWDEGFRFVEA